MEKEEIITTDLIPINTNPIVLFQENGLDPILNEIKRRVDNFESDATTSKGRKEIASFAYKIAQSKTFIDNAGKELVAKQKHQLKIIDIERKRSRDFLDEQKDLVRLPLTEFEEAEKEKERIKQYNEDWKTALIEDNIFNREREIARKEAEAARIAEEQQREKERQEYEQKLKDEATAQVKREAKEAVERAEHEKIAAIERAKIEKEIALKEREEAIEIAEKEKIEAIELEKRKAKQEAERIERERIREQERIKLEDEQRAADTTHRITIKKAALADLELQGFDTDIAKQFINAVSNGKVSYISINY